jgi:hypothetical protein
LAPNDLIAALDATVPPDSGADAATPTTSTRAPNDLSGVWRAVSTSLVRYRMTLQATATGELTLHGTTKSVTFDVLAMVKNGRIGVIGSIPIVFADYGIPNPSFATVTTADNGMLEFIVVLQRS